MSYRGIETGRLCESKAVRFLEERGYRVLERNYRCLFGEIDIIAEEGGYIVFVEVKSRAAPLFGEPYLRVTRKKRASIIKSALAYLKRRGSVSADCRIDVVSICLDNNRMELIRDAFGIEALGLR